MPWLSDSNDALVPEEASGREGQEASFSHSLPGLFLVAAGMNSFLFSLLGCLLYLKQRCSEDCSADILSSVVIAAEVFSAVW